MKRKICLFLTTFIMLLCMVMPSSVSANDAGYLYKVYVSTNDGFLNMRNNPSTNAKIIIEIPDCIGVDIYSTDGDWGYGECYLDSDYHVGWIYLPGTEMTYQRARDKAGKSVHMKRVVNSTDGFVNLRHEPTTKLTNVMQTIPNGQEIVVTRKTDRGWGLVYYGGETGWVALSETTEPIIEPAEPESEYIQTASPVLTQPENVQPSNWKKGSISLEGDRLLDGNALILILIGVAIFLIVVVAILMIVILNRGNKAQYQENMYNRREPHNYPPEQNTGVNYHQQHYQNQTYNQQNYQDDHNQNYSQ